MFCPYCGTNLPADSRFCSECGKAVTNAQTKLPHGTPPVSRPDFVDPVRPNPFLKLLGWLFGISFLIGIVVVTGGFISQQRLTPVEELFSYGDWYYASVDLHNGDDVIRKGNTEYKQDIDQIWEDIRGEKVRELDEDIYDRVTGAEHISLFLMEEDGDGSIYLAVTPAGEMYLNDDQGDIHYFEDAQNIYYAVKEYLPVGDNTSLKYCLPNGNCSSLSISFYDQDMNQYDSVYIYEPEVIRESLDRLQNMTVKYGGGIDYSFKGYMAMVGITEEDGDYYFLQIHEDGTADIPQRNWVYGVYEAVDLYNALWDELCILKGY